MYTILALKSFYEYKILDLYLLSALWRYWFTLLASSVTVEKSSVFQFNCYTFECACLKKIYCQYRLFVLGSVHFTTVYIGQFLLYLFCLKSTEFPEIEICLWTILENYQFNVHFMYIKYRIHFNIPFPFPFFQILFSEMPGKWLLDISILQVS